MSEFIIPPIEELLKDAPQDKITIGAKTITDAKSPLDQDITVSGRETIIDKINWFVAEFAVLIDNASHTDAGITQEVGFDISEDAGASWKPFRRWIRDGKSNPMPYFFLNVRIQQRKPFSFLLRPIVNTKGGQMSIDFAYYWAK